MLVEGPQAGELCPGFAWDESVVAGVTTTEHAEGTRAATLTFDLATYAWPSLSLGFPYPQDFGEATRFSVDLYAPAGSKLEAALSITGGDRKKEKKAATEAQPVPAGKWKTLTFRLKDPDRVLAGARGWSLSFSGSPTGRTTVLIDNFRIVK